MKPEQIIDQFKSTVQLIVRKKFLSDDERYHQMVGAYEMAQSVLRPLPGDFPEETELPEHSISTHLDKLEELFRELCVPLKPPEQVGR